MTLYDDDECWLGDLDMIAAGGDTLDVDGDAVGATGITMGFGFSEEYEDFTYEDWATTGTAFVTGSSGSLVGGPSGVELVYDDYSGWFVANGPAVGVAAGDLHSGSSFAVLASAATFSLAAVTSGVPFWASSSRSEVIRSIFLPFALIPASFASAWSAL